MSAVSPTAEVVGSGGNPEWKGTESCFLNLALQTHTCVHYCLFSAPCPEKPVCPRFWERPLTDGLVDSQGSLTYHCAHLGGIRSCLLLLLALY